MAAVAATRDRTQFLRSVSPIEMSREIILREKVCIAGVDCANNPFIRLCPVFHSPLVFEHGLWRSFEVTFEEVTCCGLPSMDIRLMRKQGRLGRKCFPRASFHRPGVRVLGLSPMCLALLMCLESESIRCREGAILLATGDEIEFSCDHIVLLSPLTLMGKVQSL